MNYDTRREDDGDQEPPDRTGNDANHTRREDHTNSDNHTGSEDPAPGPNHTRREEPSADANHTRREDQSASTDHPSEAGSSPAGTFSRVIPLALSDRFEFHSQLGKPGAEADLFRVFDRTDGQHKLVKLYRQHIVLNEHTLADLQRLSASPGGTPHLVQLWDYGAVDGCWYEVLEWCEHGSLDELNERGTSVDVESLIREVSEALRFLHADGGKVHRDIKPANILVRRVQPLDLVLGDFGLVGDLAGSRRHSSVKGTVAYLAPEVLLGNELTKSADFWALGMIVAEIAGGQHPFMVDGVMLAERTIVSSLAQRGVDLSNVADNRLRQLCAGLLHRDSTLRWGADEVDRWLNGETLDVADDVGARKVRAVSIFFDGDEYHEPVALASAMQSKWNVGFQQLMTERNSVLVDAVTQLCDAYNLEGALRYLDRSSTNSIDELTFQYAQFLLTLDPELHPIFAGVDLSPAGLEQAAVAVVESGGEGPAATLSQIRDLGMLEAWRSLDGVEDGPATQQRWREASRDLTSRLGNLSTNGYTPTAAESNVANARVLLTVIDPDHQLPQLNDAIAGLSGPTASWWNVLPTDNGPQMVTKLLSHSTAVSQEQRTRSQSEQSEREQREARERERHQAEAAERQRFETQDRARLRRTLWSIGLFVPAAFIGAAIIGTDRQLQWAIDGVGAWRAIGLTWFLGAVPIILLASVLTLVRGHFGIRPAATVLALIGLIVSTAALVYRRDIANWNREQANVGSAKVNNTDSSSNNIDSSAAADPSGPSSSTARDLFEEYLFTAISGDHTAAWNMLTTSYQAKYGGYSKFSEFWSTISGAQIEQSSGTVYDYYTQLDINMSYQLKSGKVSREHVVVTVEDAGGALKISDYEFIGLL